MSNYKNRVKVHASASGGVGAPFTLGLPVVTFQEFPNGETRYTALASTGEWEVGLGTVTGLQLVRDTLEENYLKTTEFIDFTGLPLQVAQTLTADAINTFLDDQHVHDNFAILNGTEESFTTVLKGKLDDIEEFATADQIASEVPFTPQSLPYPIDATNVQDAIIEVREELNYNHVHRADQVTFEPPVTMEADNVQDALEELDSDMVNHGHPADAIAYDSTNDPLYTNPEVQSLLAEHSIGLVERTSVISGVISGLELSLVNSTTFRVAVGEGVIIDNTTNPETADATRVVISEAISEAVRYDALEANITRVYLQSDKSIYQSVDKTERFPHRDYIFLGLLVTINGILTEAITAPNVIKQTPAALHDTMLNDIRLEGCYVNPVTNALSIWVEEGEYFFPGINWNNDRKNPNSTLFSADGGTDIAANFYTLTKTGILTNVLEATIPLAYNPNDSVMTGLQPEESTIHRLYSMGIGDATRELILLGGQNIYPDVTQAKTQIRADTDKTVFPAALNNANFLAYICVQGDAVDFTDGTKAWIVDRDGLTDLTVSLPAGYHDVLYNRDYPDQHPISSIGDGTPEGQLSAVLANMINWVPVWAPGTYPPMTMTVDGAYTMMSNKNTSDRPSPVPQGDPYDIYQGLGMGPNSATGNQLIFGTRYIVQSTGYLNSYRVNTTVGNNYTVYMVADPEGVAQLTELINFTAGTDGWVNFGLQPILLNINDVFDIVVLTSQPDAIDTTWTGNWNYTTPKAAASVPLPGQMVQPDDLPSILRIHKTDADGNTEANRPEGDKLSDLEVGDIIDSGVYRYAIQSITDVIDYLEVGVSPTIQSPDGLINFTFETKTDSPLAYVEELNYYNNNYPGEVFGLWGLDTNYSNITPDGHAYGVDIEVQDAYISPDWDLVASNANGLISSGGDEQDSVTWGNIFGNISAQTDLQAQFATKEDTIDRNTAFNKNFGIAAGTVCEGNDTRLTNDRYPLAHNHDERYYTEGETDTLLNGKVDNDQVLTPVPGDAVFTDTLKTMSVDPPANPVSGQEWTNINTGISYAWYTDSDSSQWIQT